VIKPWVFSQVVSKKDTDALCVRIQVRAQGGWLAAKCCMGCNVRGFAFKR
jgi:hypothetical protein